MTDELLTLLLEEVSVLTSQHRRPKPLTIPRPTRASKQPDPPGTVNFAEFAKVLAAAGRVRVVEGAPGG